MLQSLVSIQQVLTAALFLSIIEAAEIMAINNILEIPDHKPSAFKAMPPLPTTMLAVMVAAFIWTMTATGGILEINLLKS